MVQTSNDKMQCEGEARIDGVPGTSAPVTCNYLDVADSTCGSLLRTAGLLSRGEQYVTGVDQ